MTDNAGTPDSYNNNHTHSHRPFDSISGIASTGSEHSLSALCSTTAVTLASNQQLERSEAVLVMAATTQSSHLPVPRDTQLLTSHGDNLHCPSLHRYGAGYYQNEAPRQIRPLITSPSASAALYGDHGRLQNPQSTMPESETNGLSSRKRTASISTKDANKVPQVQDMSLNATSNSYASTFVGRSGETRELICLCTKAPKVPRPRNGTYKSLLLLLFSLYASYRRDNQIFYYTHLFIDTFHFFLSYP